jgi:hypothetical protein
MIAVPLVINIYKCLTLSLHVLSIKFCCHLLTSSWPGSSVSITTGYRLNSLGIDPGGGKIFCTCPDQPWGPLSLLYNGYWVFPGGKERPGRDADPSPLSRANGHERVELYLYSPYGLYSLYTASVPAQKGTC